MANSSAILIAVLLFPGGLFALAFGLALKGADRRVAARLQGRVGPPLAQPFFDIVKLGFKRTMVPVEACEPVFLGAPLIGAASMLLAVTLIPIAGVYAPDPHNRRPAGPALSAGHPRRRADDRRLGLRLALRRHRLLARNGDDARLRGTDRAGRRSPWRCASGSPRAVPDVLAHRNRALSASARRIPPRPRDVAGCCGLRLLLSRQSRHRAVRHPRGRDRSAGRPAARVLRPGARPVQGHVGAESGRGARPRRRAVHAAAAHRRASASAAWLGQHAGAGPDRCNRRARRRGPHAHRPGLRLLPQMAAGARRS